MLSRRPLLLACIEQAKKTGAIILIKEVTRLTRFSLLYEYLVATGVKFICTEYPTDSPMLMGFRVKIGEDEALKISERTKSGLAKSEKPRGYRGLDNLKKINHKKRIAVLKDRAVNNPNNKRAGGYICQLIKDGWSFTDVAKRLNKEGFRTARGLDFAPTTVKRLYERVC